MRDGIVKRTAGIKIGPTTHQTRPSTPMFCPEPRFVVPRLRPSVRSRDSLSVGVDARFDDIDDRFDDTHDRLGENDDRLDESTIRLSMSTIREAGWTNGPMTSPIGPA